MIYYEDDAWRPDNYGAFKLCKVKGSQSILYRIVEYDKAHIIGRYVVDVFEESFISDMKGSFANLLGRFGNGKRAYFSADSATAKKEYRRRYHTNAPVTIMYVCQPRHNFEAIREIERSHIVDSMLNGEYVAENDIMCIKQEFDRIKSDTDDNYYCTPTPVGELNGHDVIEGIMFISKKDAKKENILIFNKELLEISEVHLISADEDIIISNEGLNKYSIFDANENGDVIISYNYEKAFCE